FDNVDSSLDASLPSGAGLTIQQIREGVAATIKESLRHLPNVSSAIGTMFEIGSIEDNWFDMTLLEIGDAGSLALPNGGPSGFQLVPLVTGNGTQTNPQSGAAVDSTAFDGVSEISLGSGATANMLKIDYDGKWEVVASCKPAPSNQQNNREIETDLWVFDSAGAPIRSIGFISSANQGTNGRTFTQNIPRATLDASSLGANEWLGLVARKYAGEQPTTATLQKAFLQITLMGLGD
ncbi:MAG: hypothetical protein GY918_04910, partial [Gammaproteobacteria bacterium]|nr:hypothetical protein [Gammaproteobacteria bacterium]